MFPRRNRPHLLALIVLVWGVQQTPCQVFDATPYTLYVRSYHTYFWDPDISYQIARLKAQEVKRAKLENRRREGELLLWERANLPTPQDDRERDAEERLRRSRASAFDTEIYSGYALNVLLTDAVKIYDSGQGGGDAVLSPDLLKQINVTSGKANANIAIIRTGKLPWPFLWRSLRERPQFAEHFQRIDQLIPEAVKQAKQGDVDAKILDEIIFHVDELDRNLIDMARSRGDKVRWSTLTYSDGKAFLQRLNEAIKVLERPGAARYFSGVFDPRGRTVSELVQYMKQFGMQFAPVLAGSEQAYKSLYLALRDYDEQAGSKTRPRR
jgi:hypothetical protein